MSDVVVEDRGATLVVVKVVAKETKECEATVLEDLEVPDPDETE